MRSQIHLSSVTTSFTKMQRRNDLLLAVCCCRAAVAVIVAALIVFEDFFRRDAFSRRCAPAGFLCKNLNTIIIKQRICLVLSRVERFYASYVQYVQYTSTFSQNWLPTTSRNPNSKLCLKMKEKGSYIGENAYLEKVKKNAPLLLVLSCWHRSPSTTPKPPGNCWLARLLAMYAVQVRTRHEINQLVII